MFEHEFFLSGFFSKNSTVTLMHVTELKSTIETIAGDRPTGCCHDHIRLKKFALTRSMYIVKVNVIPFGST